MLIVITDIFILLAVVLPTTIILLFLFLSEMKSAYTLCNPARPFLLEAFTCVSL